VPTKNPVHPGRIVKHDYLEPLGLSATEGAKVLGVTRQTLTKIVNANTKIVNAQSAISPEMAIRLTKAFGSTPETWLRMQLACDLAAARKNESKIKVRRQIRPARIARIAGQMPATARLISVHRLCFGARRQAQHLQDSVPLPQNQLGKIEQDSQ